MEQRRFRKATEAYSPGCVERIFTEVHMQNRAYGPGTLTDSATSNTQGPELEPLHAARQYKDALGQYAATPQDADGVEG
jgi:hypothetical protein